MILLAKEIETLHRTVENIELNGGEASENIKNITENLVENVKKLDGGDHVCYSVLSLRCKENLKEFLSFLSENRAKITLKKDIKHYKNIEKLLCLEFIKLDFNAA